MRTRGWLPVLMRLLPSPLMMPLMPKASASASDETGFCRKARAPYLADRAVEGLERTSAATDHAAREAAAGRGRVIDHELAGAEGEGVADVEHRVAVGGDVAGEVLAGVQGDVGVAVDQR